MRIKNSSYRYLLFYFSLSEWPVYFSLLVSYWLLIFGFFFPWHFYCWKLWYFLCSFVLLLLTVWLIFDAIYHKLKHCGLASLNSLFAIISFFNAIETEPRNFVFECLIWFSLNSSEKSASSSTLICVMVFCLFYLHNQCLFSFCILSYVFKTFN